MSGERAGGFFLYLALPSLIGKVKEDRVKFKGLSSGG